MHPNKGLIRRSLDFISFGISAFICGIFQPKPEVILAITPQFFCGIAGCCLALIKKVPFVLILCDLWPDSIVSNGIINKNWSYKLIKKIECWMYHKSSSVIILSEYFKKYLTELGVDPDKITISISGANKDFYPREKNQSILDYYNLTEKFVVGYIGTFGASHNHEDILSVAKSLNTLGNQEISFFMVGDGFKREKLVQQSQKILDNVIIDGPFPGKIIPEYWSVVDLAIVPLALTETNKTILPSKILEAMAMGIPVLLYAPDGEAKAFLAQSHTGWSVLAGDQVALEEMLLQLATNKHLVFGQRSQTVAFAQQFTREEQAQKLLEHLALLSNEIVYEKI